jgi:hypothetical protein
MSIGDVTSRLRDRYQDKWGQWFSQTFQGRAGRLVTVISSAYQVVTRTRHAAHQQQQHNNRVFFFKPMTQ